LTLGCSLNGGRLHSNGREKRGGKYKKKKKRNSKKIGERMKAKKKWCFERGTSVLFERKIESRQGRGAIVLSIDQMP